MITKTGRMAQKDENLRKQLYDKYIPMYTNLDAAHGKEHIDTVLSNVRALSGKLRPAEANQVYAAGLLHDVGLKEGRDGHARRGAAFVDKERKYLRNFFNDDDLHVIRKAILNHRSSTGKPTSVQEKIVADADRLNTNPLRRSYLYHTSKLNKQPEDALRDAAAFIEKKYDVGGPGRRSHFPETEKLFRKYYDPVIQAHKDKDWNMLRASAGVPQG